MAKRSFARTDFPAGGMIDMRTGLPAEITTPVICQQIHRHRQRLGMEQKALAQAVGVTANAVSNWERGRVRPDVSLLPDICRALDITLYQLYELNEPGPRLTASEAQFLAEYRQLSAGNRLVVRTLTQSLNRAQQLEQQRPLCRLLRFDRQLAAGVGDPAELEDQGTPLFVYADAIVGSPDCVFTVNGDSMEPDYPDGSMVLVQRTSRPEDLQAGMVGAFMIGSEAYIKTFQPDGLHSLNPSYPVMRFADYEHVYLIGRVLGKLEKEDIARESEIRRYTAAHPELLMS